MTRLEKNSCRRRAQLLAIASLTFSFAAFAAGPLRQVPVMVVDIPVFVPAYVSTGNSVPSFDNQYIQDYQYAAKYTLTLLDGSNHYIPQIEAANGPWIPYAQVAGSCWDTGYLHQCSSGNCKQPRCINLVQGDALSIAGRLAIPGGRQVLPGEITPDGYSLAPIETSIDRSGAGWRDLYPITVSFNDVVLQTQTSYFYALPSEGGTGPHPSCNVGTCYSVAPRLVIESFGPLGPGVRFIAYLSGLSTSGNLSQDIADLTTATTYLNHPNDPTTTRTPTQQAYINFITANHLNPALGELVGHSGGAVCAIALGNDGYAGKVTAIAVPFFIDSSALVSKPWVDITVYSGQYDIISNGLFLNVNQDRVNFGVNVIQGNTGDYFTGHNRSGYCSSFGYCF